MSSATSIPCSWAAARRQRKSSSVPNWGWTAWCPPASLPIDHGLPTSRAVARNALLRPLRFVTPMGWIGGEQASRGARQPVGRVGGVGCCADFLDQPCPDLDLHFDLLAGGQALAEVLAPGREAIEHPDDPVPMGSEAGGDEGGGEVVVA